MHIVKKSMSKFYVKKMSWTLLPIIVVITFLYLYVNVICYFQVHRDHVKSDLSLVIFCFVIML
jgi:hypothetical protein